MDSQFQGQQNTKQMREQIMRSINQYQQYLHMALNNQNREDQQLQFYLRMISNQYQKIQVDMLGLYGYLQYQQQYDIKDIIQQLMGVAKLIKQILQAKTGSKQKQISKIKNQQYCYGCKLVIQKMNIFRIKQQYGVTQGEIIQFSPNNGKIDIKQCLKDDEYQERQKMHIDNLQFHINELMRLMEKEFQSKTSTFLGKDDEIFRKKPMQLAQQSAIMKQNEKQYYQTEQFKNKFKENFMKHIRLPIQQTVSKMLKNIEKAKRIKQKQRLTQTGIQTIFSTEKQININLQCQILDLKNQIKKLKIAKAENEKNILKYLQNQSQLKKQLVTLQQSNTILQEKFKRIHEQSSSTQSKLTYEINNKTKQVGKLQKTILQLRQKILQMQKSRIQLDQSKQTMASIKQKKLGTSRKSIQKLSKKIINPRPSLDFNVNSEQAESNNISNHPRFQVIRKHTSYIRNAKISVENNVREQKKVQNYQQICDQDQYTLSRISSHNNEQKQKKLQIVSAFNLTIVALKDGQTQNTKQKNLFNKKVKTLRLFKVNKKQQNQTQNIMSRTFNENMSQDIFGSARFKQDADIYKEKMSLNYKESTENYRVKTEASELRNQNRKQNKQNRSIERLKTGTVIVRQLRAKNGDQQILKQSPVLSQIKPEHLILFGGDKYASQFEKGAGIWPHLVLVDKLVIDFQNASLSNQIQKYFKYLQQNNTSKFVQYLSFLSQPLSFLQAKRKDQRLDISQPNSLGIKDLFVRLIRFHKIMHKNCNHINQFLQSIGFRQF